MSKFLFRFSSVVGTACEQIASKLSSSTRHFCQAHSQIWLTCTSPVGQTGSGKTHTIMGERNEAGAISLAIDDIFATAAASSGDTYTFTVDMVEIYNEELRDLLAPVAAKQKQAQSLQIKVRKHSKLNFPAASASYTCGLCLMQCAKYACSFETSQQAAMACAAYSHALWCPCMTCAAESINAPGHILGLCP